MGRRLTRAVKRTRFESRSGGLPSPHVDPATSTTNPSATTRRCDVVITTRNRPEPLRRCLASLADQSARDVGIIVVDDHSDEPLEPIVAQVTASEDFGVEPVVVRLPEPSGPAAGRNAGVAASNAEYIIFIDDDIVVDRHLVEIHLSEVMSTNDPSAPIVTRGPFVEPPDWNPTPWNLWEAKMATRGTNAIVRGDYAPTWRQFHTGNNCLSREVFLAVGGFDETFLRAEDDELGARLHEYGCQFHFVPSALAWHYSNRSLEAWLHIPRAYAHYTVVIDRMYPHFGYLAKRQSELSHSNALLRVARRVSRGPRRTRLTVWLAVQIAVAAHRVRLTAITMSALSAAYDLSFVEALRAAMAEATTPEATAHVTVSST